MLNNTWGLGEETNEEIQEHETALNGVIHRASEQCMSINDPVHTLCSRGRITHTAEEACGE
jgi:hypothetical protein